MYELKHDDLSKDTILQKKEILFTDNCQELWVGDDKKLFTKKVTGLEAVTSFIETIIILSASKTLETIESFIANVIMNILYVNNSLHTHKCHVIPTDINVIEHEPIVITYNGEYNIIINTRYINSIPSSSWDTGINYINKKLGTQIPLAKRSFELDLIKLFVYADHAATHFLSNEFKSHNFDTSFKTYHTMVTLTAQNKSSNSLLIDAQI